MRWVLVSSAARRGLTDTDFRALLRSSASPAISGPALTTGERPPFAEVLALTRIEVMSAAYAGMRPSDPRRSALAKEICSARSSIMSRGAQ